MCNKNHLYHVPVLPVIPLLAPIHYFSNNCSLLVALLNWIFSNIHLLLVWVGIFPRDNQRPAMSCFLVHIYAYTILTSCSLSDQSTDYRLIFFTGCHLPL